MYTIVDNESACSFLSIKFFAPIDSQGRIIAAMLFAIWGQLWLGQAGLIWNFNTSPPTLN